MPAHRPNREVLNQPMRASKLLGVLFLVSSVFLLTQSSGWRFGLLALSGGLAFMGLLLLSRRRSRRSPQYVRRTRSTYIAAQAAAK
jgi:hypothetical protein